MGSSSQVTSSILLIDELTLVRGEGKVDVDLSIEVVFLESFAVIDGSFEMLLLVELLKIKLQEVSNKEIENAKNILLNLIIYPPLLKINTIFIFIKNMDTI